LLDIADGFVRNHTQAFPARQRSVSKPRRASVSRVVITAARPDDLTATATLDARNRAVFFLLMKPI